MSRTNLPVSDEVYDRLAEHKSDDDTWEDVLERAADALDGTDTSEQTAHIPPEQVDEIAGRVASETVSELEERMRGL